MQTLVVSDRSIELFYCDWKTQIKLVKVLILNQESVEHFFYERETGWHILGLMKQYEPPRMTFHKVENVKDSKIIAQCYIEMNKYVLTE
jgi:hypothetical protein